MLRWFFTILTYYVIIISMKAKKSKSKKVNIFKPTLNRVFALCISVLLLTVIVQGYFLSVVYDKQKEDTSYAQNISN